MTKLILAAALSLDGSWMLRHFEQPDFGAVRDLKDVPTIDAAMKYCDTITVGRVVPNAPRRAEDSPPYQCCLTTYHCRSNNAAALNATVPGDAHMGEPPVALFS